MGGAVSTGEDNEELIDNLVSAGYIKTRTVEKGLRLVDRGDYYLEVGRNQAYKDLAWKHGNLHISAPCIYAEVLECLELRPGLSFLNLGSGTGYLNTIVGLILGVHGVNHGIELHQDVIDYARLKLKEFIRDSPSLDLMELCLPEFVCGNCLQFDVSSLPLLYDRVYCGAAVPHEYENFIINLVKVGGIVVMPCQDQLRKVVRTDYQKWETQGILPVSFASLILPNSKVSSEETNFLLPERNPVKLQDLCRAEIRAIIRANTETECPEIVCQCLIKKDDQCPIEQSSGTTLMNRRQLIGHRIYEVNTGGIFGVIRIPQRHVRTESDDDSSSNEEEPGERQEQQHSRNEITIERIEEEGEAPETGSVESSAWSRSPPPESHEYSEMEGSLPAGTNQEEENSNEPRQMEEDADDDNQLVTSIQNDVTSEEAEMADTNSRLSPPRRKFGVCDNRNFTKLQGRKGHSLFQHSEHVGESSKRKIRSLSESLSSAMDKLKDEKDQNDLNTNTGTPKSTKRLKPHSSLSSSTLLTAEDDDNRLESVEDSTGTDESSEEPDNQSEWARRQENRERNRKLSKAIRAKIASLPLPDQLKNFVDFFRD